jgi:hypothetical protein
VCVGASNLTTAFDDPNFLHLCVMRFPWGGAGFLPLGYTQCLCKVAREVVGGPRGPIVIIVEVIQCKVD